MVNLGECSSAEMILMSYKSQVLSGETVLCSPVARDDHTSIIIMIMAKQTKPIMPIGKYD